MSINKSELKSFLTLDPETYLELFELYVGETYGFVRFHAGKNFTSNIVYKGNSYFSCPVEFGGAESSSSGKRPRPVIKISNINGFITNYIKNRNDLNNCTIKRTKIFLKNIDDVNFPDSLNPFYSYKAKWSFPDYGPEFFSDTYIINNKISENKYTVEFELSSPLDLENVFMPSRVIMDNMCPFVYRGAGCCYGKKNNFTQNVLKDMWSGGSTEDGWTEFKEIGIPVADEFDKHFLSNQGYALRTLNDKGLWDKDTEYTTGDFVLVQTSFSYDFNKENIQASSDDLIGDYYVCIQTGVSGVVPKLDKANWVKDACSKSIIGCNYRFNDYYNMEGLDGPEKITKDIPYGGFPGTRPYEYRTS